MHGHVHLTDCTELQRYWHLVPCIMIRKRKRKRFYLFPLVLMLVASRCLNVQWTSDKFHCQQNKVKWTIVSRFLRVSERVIRGNPASWLHWFCISALLNWTIPISQECGQDRIGKKNMTSITVCKVLERMLVRNATYSFAWLMQISESGPLKTALRTKLLECKNCVVNDYIMLAVGP